MVLWSAGADEHHPSPLLLRFYCSALTSLSLACNKLSALPLAMSKLTRLTVGVGAMERSRAPLSHIVPCKTHD